ncbi:MAG: hypothetical protein DA408_12455 [Bacteroidetes bacterium]|nr:MAG: hypothetical protein DA408_12455 [Bacteroidota bacterium]
MNATALGNARRYLGWMIFLLILQSPLFAQLPPDFYDTKILDGFELPLGITFDANGRGYIWEKAGQVYLLDTTGQLLPEPLIDLSEEVASWKDHGLNGFCLDNDFLHNGYIYLYYVVDLYHYWHAGTPDYQADSTITFQPTFGRVTRYQADPATGFTTVIPESRTVLLGESIGTGVPILYEFHGLGTLLQGEDGTLLCSTGETTGGLQIGIGNEPGDTYAPQAIAWGIITPDQDLGSYKAQYLGTLNGKVLRLASDTGDGLPSNPFFDSNAPRSAQSRIWALGFRNPYRMVLRPHTGSHYAAEGDPGTLVVGDVGNGSWEELNIVDRGGQNFGWPLLEGIRLAWKFWIQEVPDNPLAPNPLDSCGRAYLNFRELLALPMESGPYVPGIPCADTIPIPAELHPFYAQQPLLVWNNSQWNSPTRAAVPAWDENGYPAENFLDSLGATVSGEAFEGYSSLAGVFYEGTQFPAAYQGKYFHFDFSGWIRTFDLDDSNTLSGVDLFHEYTKDIIHLAQNLADGALYYTNLAGEVHRIAYGGNPAPVAIIEADRFYGASPLPVQFSAIRSYDPNNNPLTYAWDFGDGTTSTEIAPLHTFVSTQAGVPQSFPVRLTVTDSLGASHTDERIVALNNTPPVVTIVSFNDGDQYSLEYTSLLRLKADVYDAETPAEELTYEWRTFLHHNEHFHPDPVIFEPETYFLVSPLGCGQEEYFYRIELTVTDPGGLATTVSQRILPFCGDQFTQWIELAGTVQDHSVDLTWGTLFEEDIVQLELQRASDYFNFTVLATIPPAGNSTRPRRYAYQDAAPLRGANIYRIKAVTATGAFAYSNLFQTSFPAPKDWRVFPNPASQQLTFYILEAQAEMVHLELFSVAGQRLRQATFAAEIGQEWQRELPIDQLPAGLYNYRLLNGEAVYVGQVVVAR